MATGKPLIAILMAVYEPRLDWLREQLLSLNGQTYPNLRLYIRDDCSPTVPFETIQAMAEECVTRFPFSIARNEENLGSNGTFQRLTQEGEGEWFAYCDQDDVWLPEKLETLERALGESGALLGCSDMYVIDGEGRQVTDSITKVRRRHIFHSGTGLAPGLLTRNFATGCTTLVKAAEAKAAIPFCPYMYHDHYLNLWCAARGSVLSLDKPLIRYRIHGGNQTGILAGITDKASYGRSEVEAMLRRMEWLEANFPCEGELRQSLAQAAEWARARKENWESGRGKRTVWKYRKFGERSSVFEIFTEKVPEWIFKWLLRLIKGNRI